MVNKWRLLGFALIFTVALVIVGLSAYRAEIALKLVHIWPELHRTVVLGDGRPAALATICSPMGLALDAQDNLYFSDRGQGAWGRALWKLDGENLQVLASERPYLQSGIDQAKQSRFGRPDSVAIYQNRVYLIDAFLHTIFRLGDGGQVLHFAGSGKPGFAGDGGVVADAAFNRPGDLSFDSQGYLYVADTLNHRVRRISPEGIIVTIAGTGEQGFSPDGTPAVNARLNSPWGITVDAMDRLIISDSGNQRVRRVDRDGTLTTIAGSGELGYAGDGGLAIEAQFNSPEDLAYSGDGILHIVDEHNHAIRLVDRKGTITTLQYELSDPDGPPRLNDPESLVINGRGERIVADGNNARILAISKRGKARRIVGSGLAGC